MQVYYMRFKCPSPDKWYLLWAREWDTGWSVDRLYLPSRIAILEPGCNFWELPWSSCKHDGLIEDAALAMLKEVADRRLDHGYIIEESGIAVYDELEDGSFTHTITLDYPDTPGHSGATALPEGTNEIQDRKD